MGEITEMMEEGILCQTCGVYLGNEINTGTWTFCEDCKKDNEKKE